MENDTISRARSNHHLQQEKGAAALTKKILFSKDKRLRQCSPWFDDPFNIARGEAALWVAVIAQAMMDAHQRARNSEMNYQKQEAIYWLTENSRDFVQVCLMAGMEPDAVRRKAKKSLLSPVQWRKPAGKGRRYLQRKAHREHLKKLQRAHEEAEPNACVVITGPWSLQS